MYAKIFLRGPARLKAWGSGGRGQAMQAGKLGIRDGLAESHREEGLRPLAQLRRQMSVESCR